MATRNYNLKEGHTVADIKTIVALDIEATCWDNGQGQGEQVSEIIEIGAVKIDIATLTVLDSFQTFVRPVASTISPFCTSLTSIVWDDVKQAPPLQGAANNLVKFGSRNCLFATWGYYDCAMFEKMVDAKFLDAVPFTWRNVLNAKVMAQAAFGEFKGIGQGKAAAKLGIPPNRNAHRADSDAMETALILIELFKAQRVLA